MADEIDELAAATFRFAAKKVFLTYARADALVDKTNVLDKLREKHGPKAIVVGEEEHDDGGKHFHVLMIWSRRKESRNVRFFDIDEHHPNIVVPDSLEGTYDYVTKGGNFTNVGFKFVKESLSETARRFAAEGGTVQQIVLKVVEEHGDKALGKISQLQTYVAYLQKPGVVHQPAMPWPGNFAVDPRDAATFMNFTVDIQMPVGQRIERKSLWLTGPSRLGKTVFARSLGTHWYMNGSWNVDQYSDDAQYGVLDDIEWERLRPYYKGLLGMQLDVTVTDKYRHKSTIRGGRPVIVITNEVPDFTHAEREWLMANVEFVKIDYKMWNEVPPEPEPLVADMLNNVFRLPSPENDV